MTIQTETLTAEQIQKHYDAAMDSVNLINGGKPEGMEADEWQATVERNKAHLQIMLAKTYWTNQNLAPLQQAAA